MAAPFRVHSVHFDFPGGQAIELRDPASDEPVGASPEWVDGVRNEAAAYVRGTVPQVRVVFRSTGAGNGEYTVGAGGAPMPIEERQVTLTFDPETGLSRPEIFRAGLPLPDRIGVHATALDWFVREPTGATLAAGTSNHRLCTTWRAMTPHSGQLLHRWVYEPFMVWTCEWAAGRDGEKDVCDAIIANVASSGLRYGVPMRVTGMVRQMLLNGGGMCGDWYKVFQQMAHCQGVFVHRRAFVVDWREMANREVRWCAIVIRRGGVGQGAPTEPVSAFLDNDIQYPIVAPVALTARRERRYQFFGHRNKDEVEDGHCVNFLVHEGKLYLYDACFYDRPIEIAAALPGPDMTEAMGGADLAPFKSAYFNDAVDYMLGSLYNGATFHECTVRESGELGDNGMTVRTTIIPDVVDGEPGLTFYWSE